MRIVNRKTVACAMAWASFCVLLGLSRPANAQTETVLYTFTGSSDGGYPIAGLIRDTKGNLYGTTYWGGTGGGVGNGVAFKVSPTGVETVLHSFGAGTDGSGPAAALTFDRKHDIYGTTLYGGLSGFAGAVFELTKKGKTETETVVYNFCPLQQCADGEAPRGKLAFDATGNLYGTTNSGGPLGSSARGTVFKLAPTGTESVLYGFTGGTDGWGPIDGLVFDKAGNLYGTTVQGGDLSACGGYGCGTVFKVSPTGAETVLYAFTGGSDGSYPSGDLVFDKKGNLYGTAGYGGDNGGSGCTTGGAPPGCGTVFMITPAGAFTVLYTFTGEADGAYPNGGLVLDKKGDLYGTAGFGGSAPASGYNGFGTIFELTSSNTYKVLFTFTGGADGGNPQAGVILDRQANLYGTASRGGNLSGCNGYGCGTVFKLTP